MILRAYNNSPRVSQAYGPRSWQPRKTAPLFLSKPGPPVIHEWRRRIGAAFCAAPEPLTGSQAERLARGQAERQCHQEIISNVRQGLIAGRLSPEAAAQALTDEADHCVQAMLQIALDGMAEDYGPPPGRFSVLGLGKFGGGELALGSDLDVIFVYEPASQNHELAAADYFVRLSQNLIRQLHLTSAWPALYDLDLRLRPHGEDSPVATPFSGLVDYLAKDCCVWELQALTRLRAITGDHDLSTRVQAAARSAMETRAGGDDLLTEIAEMRALMDDERPGRGLWDVKLTPGGLVDIEFIVQAWHLRLARPDAAPPPSNTGFALIALAANGALSPKDAKTLHSAWKLYSGVRQVQQALRLDDLGRAGPQQRTMVARVLGLRSASALKARVAAAEAKVRSLFENLIGPVGLDQAA